MSEFLDSRGNKWEVNWTGGNFPELYTTDAITLETISDGLFTPVKYQRATIKIWTETLSPTWSGNYDSYITITLNSTTMFYGYISPNVYSLPWGLKTVKYDSFQVECECMLSKLEFIDYPKSTGFATFDAIIKKCLELAGITNGYSNGPSDWLSLGCMQENFVDDDEEASPWTCQEVIEQICTLYGVTMTMYHGDVIVIDYGTGSSTILSAPPEITTDDYFGKGGTVEFDDVYNKFSVSSSLYRNEEIITSDTIETSLTLDSHTNFSSEPVLNIRHITDKDYYFCTTRQYTSSIFDVNSGKKISTTTNTTGFIISNGTTLPSLDVLYTPYAWTASSTILKGASFTIESDKVTKDSNGNVIDYPYPTTLEYTTYLSYYLGFPIGSENKANSYDEQKTGLYGIPYKLLYNSIYSRLFSSFTSFFTYNGPNINMSSLTNDVFIVFDMKMLYSTCALFEGFDDEIKINLRVVDSSNDDKLYYVGLPMRISIGNYYCVGEPLKVNDSYKSTDVHSYEWKESATDNNLLYVFFETSDTGVFSLNKWMNIYTNFNFMDNVDADSGFAIKVPKGTSIQGNVKIEIGMPYLPLFEAPISYIDDNSTKNWKNNSGGHWILNDDDELTSTYLYNSDGIAVTNRAEYIVRVPLPTNIYIKDFSMELCGINTGSATGEEEDDDDDVVYTNVPTGQWVNDYDDIELKINSAVEGVTCKSDIMTSDGKQKTYTDDERPEHLLINKYVSHFSMPKLKYEFPCRTLDLAPNVLHWEMWIDEQKITTNPPKNTLTLIQN